MGVVGGECDSPVKRFIAPFEIARCVARLRQAKVCFGSICHRKAFLSIVVSVQADSYVQ
jgi:hypothetical protein